MTPFVFSLQGSSCFFNQALRCHGLFALATFYDHISFIVAVTFAINTFSFSLNCYPKVFLSFLNKFPPFFFLPLLKKLFDLHTKVQCYGLFYFLCLFLLPYKKITKDFTCLCCEVTFLTMLEPFTSASFLSSLIIIHAKTTMVQINTLRDFLS